MKCYKATTRSGVMLLMLGVNTRAQIGELHLPRKISFSSHYTSRPRHNAIHLISLITLVGLEGRKLLSKKMRVGSRSLCPPPEMENRQTDEYK